MKNKVQKLGLITTIIIGFVKIFKKRKKPKKELLDYTASIKEAEQLIHALIHSFEGKIKSRIEYGLKEKNINEINEKFIKHELHNIFETTDKEMQKIEARFSYLDLSTFYKKWEEHQIEIEERLIQILHDIHDSITTYKVFKDHTRLIFAEINSDYKSLKQKNKELQSTHNNS